MKAKKRGRRTIPYRTSWGEVIPGLYRRPDGRWRICSTGKEYTEHDEKVAVLKFRKWERSLCGDTTLIKTRIEDLPDFGRINDLTDHAQLVGNLKGERWLEQEVPDDLIWPWLREQLLERPEMVAEKTGIPQLATLADFSLPRSSVRLAPLLAIYEEHSSTKKDSLRHLRRAYNEFLTIMGVQTIRECSTEMLVHYASTIRKSYSDPGYVGDIFSRVKRVIKFGKKHGYDSKEIDEFLSRAEVLYAPKTRTKYQASPIDREYLHMLLAKADETDTAAILVSLNACMYVSEFLDIDEGEIDLHHGLYVRNRNKTGVIRAAVFWPRTIQAILKLPRMAGPLFRSPHGNRFHPNSYRDRFDDLRERAGVPKWVKHNHLRDGAYTAACRQGIDFHLAQILAGHLAPGQSDKYILRNPEMVRPACEAVEKQYFG